MAIKHEAVLGRSNLYNVDPWQIIVENGWNPRTDFSGHNELAASIKENGVEVPLTVKKVGDDIILLDGERRLRAVKQLLDEGCEIVSIPCLFTRPGISEPEAMIKALIRNDGKPLDPIEEAGAFTRLKGWGWSVQQIATKIGKSDVFVYRRLSLVDASEELKAEIKSKNIKLTDAEKIIKESSGKVRTQKQKAAAVKKSNRMGAKEIKALLTTKKEQQKAITDQEEFVYLSGYLKALENVLDRTTMIE